MIWRPILSRSGPTILLALIAVATPCLPAPAQDLTTDERLDRLERGLSMLQRQVYERAGGAPESDAEGGDAAAIEVRMERLEQQMRDLTGRVEEMTNHLERLRDRLSRIASAGEGRPGEGAPPPAFALAPPPAPGGSAPQPRAASLAPPDVAAPAPPAGTLTPPTPLVPRAASLGAPRAASPPAGGTLPSGPASKQYDFAFGLLKEADYPAAEEALRTFVQQHPDSALAGDAQYWLGETYYARRQYRQAASAFAEGYRRYPKGPRAAEDLLKLGMSLARSGQRRDACVALGQLDHAFPHAGAPVKARAATERKRLGCGA